MASNSSSDTSMMEWVQMYAGRPSSSRGIDRTPRVSIADSENKEAEDFVNQNMHVPLEELLDQNRENQTKKLIEYHELKSRKCPTLEEQERGPDGRIIFSETYVDFMFYRELQPLVDLRVLRRVEQIILDRIAVRDGNVVDKNKRANLITEDIRKAEIENEEPSTSSITSPVA